MGPVWPSGAPRAPTKRAGARSSWRQHCRRYLLTEHGAPDADLRSQVLLWALAAEQVRHWLRVEGRELDEVARVVAVLAPAR